MQRNLKNPAHSGIIQNVVMMGGTCSLVNTPEWRRIIAQVVNGKFYNLYSWGDLALAVNKVCMLKDSLGSKPIKFE